MRKLMGLISVLGLGMWLSQPADAGGDWNDAGIKRIEPEEKAKPAPESEEAAPTSR